MFNLHSPIAFVARTIRPLSRIGQHAKPTETSSPKAGGVDFLRGTTSSSHCLYCFNLLHHGSQLIARPRQWPRRFGGPQWQFWRRCCRGAAPLDPAIQALLAGIGGGGNVGLAGLVNMQGQGFQGQGVRIGGAAPVMNQPGQQNVPVVAQRAQVDAGRVQGDNAPAQGPVRWTANETQALLNAIQVVRTILRRPRC